MEFLLSIMFVESFWSFVGGIKSVQSNMSREAVETQDFEKPYRILIPQSGVSVLDMAGSGVIENNKEVVFRMLKLFELGSDFMAKMESDKLRIQGSFIFETFNLRSPVSDFTSFDFTMKSSNQFSITELN